MSNVDPQQNTMLNSRHGQGNDNTHDDGDVC